MPANLLVAQISDLHVVPAGSLAHGRADTNLALRRLIGGLAAFSPPLGAVVITGDLADDAEKESYEILAEALRTLECPVLAVPGNHDDPGLLSSILGGLVPGGPDRGPGLCSALTIDGYRLILVDSTIEGAHHGGLSKERLDWLAGALEGGRGRPKLVAIHHPPFPSGLGLMDEPFEGAASLGDVLSEHPGAVLCCGHLHLALAARWAGGQAVICPSVMAMELELGPAGGGSFSLGPPSYLLHHLTPAGVITHFRLLPGERQRGGPYPFLAATGRPAAGLEASA